MDVDDSENTHQIEDPNATISDNEEPEALLQKGSSNDTSDSLNQKKFIRLPLARVKNMMKLDPDCSLVSQDSIFLVTKATELFIAYLAAEALKYLQSGKRKTIMKKDIVNAIECIPHLCFLDGALE